MSQPVTLEDSFQLFEQQKEETEPRAADTICDQTLGGYGEDY